MPKPEVRPAAFTPARWIILSSNSLPTGPLKSILHENTFLTSIEPGV